jgi:hypothetical protein
LSPFDEDDPYAALDGLCARQEKIERIPFQPYLRRRGAPPALFLCDVTSTYLEGEHNALGEYGYNRDGKRGKESRTRGHVFACMLALKISREMARRLQAAFGTTDSDPHTATLPDALAPLSRLCLLHYSIDDDTAATRLPRTDVRQKEILTAPGVALPEK